MIISYHSEKHKGGNSRPRPCALFVTSRQYRGCYFRAYTQNHPEPNEVVSFGGYYREADNTICAYKTGADQGQCIAIDWSLYNAVSPVEGVELATSAGVADGSYLTVTGPVLQKMTWEEAEQTAGMTGKEGPGAWKNYVIYPTAISTDIPTGVDDINAKTVAGVKYVNTLGVESATPFSGVNIVVTTYADGTVSAVKVVK